MSAVLAADFGSRETSLDDRGILVTGWEFWRQHQAALPPPMLLAIATLPIPSLEHPLVAGRVAYYKRKRKDWFRQYLSTCGSQRVTAGDRPSTRKAWYRRPAG